MSSSKRLVVAPMLASKPVGRAKVCTVCEGYPAKGILPDTFRPICGVCAHRLRVARDLAIRIATAKRKVAA